VFFSLFFEVEPFPAILIAHRTHGRSDEFVLEGTQRPRASKGFLSRGSEPPSH